MATCKQGHPLVAENVYVSPSGGRQCKICKKASVEKRRARFKELGLDSEGKPKRPKKKRSYGE